MGRNQAAKRMKLQYDNFLVLWSEDFSKKASAKRAGCAALIAAWGLLKAVKYGAVISAGAAAGIRLRDCLSGGTTDMAKAAAYLLAAVACMVLLGVIAVYEDFGAMGSAYRNGMKKADRLDVAHFLAGNGAFYANAGKRGKIRLHVKDEGGEVTFHNLKPGEVKVVKGAPSAVYDMDRDVMVMPYREPKQKIV